jgi:tetratricopeptide (TPR) repeat protein
VSVWDDAITSILTNLADMLYYPVRFILVNNDLTMDEAECRKALGKISELKNLSIHTPPRPLKELEAYRFGAGKTKADYVYLLTKNVDPLLNMRLLSARYFFKRKYCEGIKWDVEQEKKGPFDLLMRRDLFFKRTAPGKSGMNVTLDIVPQLPPESLRFDFFCKKATTEQEAGHHESAYQFFKNAEAVKQGGAEEQYLIDLYARICFDLGKYDEAEQRCRELIEKGYGADNWIRLGKILQTQGKYEEAIQAFQKGLSEIGLTDSDVKSSVFPIIVPEDFGSFSALIGLGECLLETGNLIESSKALHRAARLKANSHRPFLGFGKLFLRTNDLDQAEEALLAASKMKEETETYRLLGHLYERKERWETAFDYYVKAFKSAAKESETALPLYHLGKALNKWKEMEGIFEDYLESHPEASSAGQYLSDIYKHLEDHRDADRPERNSSEGPEEFEPISSHSLLIGDTP